MKTMFCVEKIFDTWTNQDYQHANQRGIDTVIQGISPGLNIDNFDSVDVIIQDMLSKTENTNLGLIPLIWSFHDENNAVNFSEENIDWVASQSAKLFENYPYLSGLIFDDYYVYANWQDEFEDVDAQTEYLLNMAETVKEAIHEVKSSATLTAGVPAMDDNGYVNSVVSEGFDYIMPMVYRYYNGFPSFVGDLIEKVKITSKTDVVPILLTFLNDTDVKTWSKESLETDIRTAMRLCGSYALFMNLYLPSKEVNYLTRSRYAYSPYLNLIIGTKPSPNFLFSNVADCGNTLETTYGFGKYANDETITLDNSKSINNKEYSIKCEVNGQYKGCVPHPGSLTTKIGVPLTYSGQIYIPSELDIMVIIYNNTNGNSTTINGHDNWNEFELQYTPTGVGGFNGWEDGTWTILAIITTNNPGESSFNIGELQLEIGNEATEWQEGI